MKFETAKLAKGNTYEFEIPFDPDLIKSLEVDKQAGLIVMEYEVQNVPLLSPLNFMSEPIHVIRITNSDVYWSASYYIDEETATEHALCDYADDFGVVEFMVKLMQEEKNKLLLVMIKHLTK